MNGIERYFPELCTKMSKTYFSFIKGLILKGYNTCEYSMILKALREATELHRGQERKSGDAYITHPINVASILVECGFDYETICTALLHDTVEDTNCTLEEIENEFGSVVAKLVDGVTKMKDVSFTSKEEMKKATHQKIIREISYDARILAIKLADRLHNMVTLGALREEKRIEIASETLGFYVPLARFTGIYSIKDELQDLSLFYLYEDEFLKCYDLRCQIKNDNAVGYKIIGGEIQKRLNARGVPMSYNYKVKNVGGIYDELVRGNSLDEILDLVAIRMVVGEKDDCYKALNTLKDFCRLVPNTFYDFIKNPKENGYRSLNTNVLLDGDQQFQVRIRTKEMQKNNELGIVCNWSPDKQEKVRNMCTSLIGMDLSTIKPLYDGKVKKLGVKK